MMLNVTFTFRRWTNQRCAGTSVNTMSEMRGSVVVDNGSISGRELDDLFGVEVSSVVKVNGIHSGITSDVDNDDVSFVVEHMSSGSYDHIGPQCIDAHLLPNKVYID